MKYWIFYSLYRLMANRMLEGKTRFIFFVHHIATHTSHIVKIFHKFIAFSLCSSFFFSEALNLIHRSDKINIHDIRRYSVRSSKKRNSLNHEKEMERSVLRRHLVVKNFRAGKMFNVAECLCDTNISCWTFNLSAHFSSNWKYLESLKFSPSYVWENEKYFETKHFAENPETQTFWIFDYAMKLFNVCNLIALAFDQHFSPFAIEMETKKYKYKNIFLS
jgi:hypothetical protein